MQSISYEDIVLLYRQNMRCIDFIRNKFFAGIFNMNHINDLYDALDTIYDVDVDEPADDPEQEDENLQEQDVLDAFRYHYMDFINEMWDTFTYEEAQIHYDDLIRLKEMVSSIVRRAPGPEYDNGR